MSSPGLTQPTAVSGVRGRRSRHPWQRLVLVYLCALVALLSSRASFALTLVPMCGVHAETVAAPPISRAAEEVPLGPKRCHDKRDRGFEAREQVPLPPPTPHVDIVPRLPPLRYRLPPAPRARRPVEFLVSGERPGYQRAIERPPR
jgi:hypothetical protein